MSFLWNLLILLDVSVLVALANNFTVGYAGLLNLASAAQLAVGSYVVALATARAGLPFVVAVLLAVIAGTVFSLTIGLASLRYRKIGFALVSLAFQVLAISILRNLSATGGVLGLSVQRPFGISSGLGGLPVLAAVATAIVSFIAVASWMLGRSNWALALQATRDNELAAAAIGLPVGQLRVQSFLVSGAIIGVAGALFSVHIQFVDTSSFSPDDSILFLLALVCGGTCNTVGPLLGGTFAVALPELLRLLHVPGPAAGNLRNIVFGIAVVALVLWRPRGIAGRYQME